MDRYIHSEIEMRKKVGSLPQSAHLKKLKFLEQHSKCYLQMSHLIAIYADKLPYHVHLFTTQNSQLSIINDTTFTLIVKNMDHLDHPIQDESCGLYVLVAGFEDSLRINGKLSMISQGNGLSKLQINIEEQYFHCAKSIKRSQLWTSIKHISSKGNLLEEVKLSDRCVKGFMQQSSFLLLATQSDTGEADLSPRGDPAGFVKILDGNSVFMPERPGNKIADSLRNIIVNPSLAMVLLIPGSVETLILIGKGKLTDSPHLLEMCAVHNKTPKLGIEVSVEKVYFGINPVLADYDLWDSSIFVNRSTFPSLGMVVSEQLQSAGKVPGSGTFVGRALGKVLGAASDLAIKQDYKKNLY